ncbi:hypothetical protein IE53DRAFT_384319 [Violaceomyces palustris]|uniref:Uncharacterized protein n=1 Tax=Violaceomyces palustris TaxID=1673888 RepID=A0ACD0P522_9BASI|nr:hypothetical protein IE53DRAFT_384319 [Violaceomyces palustris]
MPDHRKQRTQDQYQEVTDFNRHVQLYLWVAITTCVGIAAFVQAVHRLVAAWQFSKAQGSRKRIQVQIPHDRLERWDSIPSTPVRNLIDASGTQKGAERLPVMACTVFAIMALFRIFLGQTNSLVERLRFPSFGSLLLLVFYATINVSLILFGSQYDIDFMAHHSARLVIGNIPLVIGLASKNNVISILTGFSYTSLSLLHRWCARLCLCLALFHTFARVWVGNDLRQRFAFWGVGALLALALTIFGASKPLRTKYYELFAYSHIVLFSIFLGCLWLHRPETSPYIYGGLALWGLDRITRAMRIIYHFGFSCFFQRSKGQRNATVEVIDGDSMKVSVKTQMRWSPGQYCFLHIPEVSAGAHPFSIASIVEEKYNGRCSDHRRSVKWAGTASDFSTDGALHALDEEESRQESRAVFIIRAHQGMTRKLMSRVESDSRALGKIEISCMTEGPYGTIGHLTSAATSAASLLLIAGGNGITFTLPILCETIRRAGQIRTVNPHLTNTKRLIFIWCIRERSHLDWVEEDLRECSNSAPAWFHLETYIHVSNSSKSETTAVESTSIKSNSGNAKDVADVRWTSRDSDSDLEHKLRPLVHLGMQGRRRCSSIDIEAFSGFDHRRDHQYDAKRIGVLLDPKEKSKIVLPEKLKIANTFETRVPYFVPHDRKLSICHPDNRNDIFSGQTSPSSFDYCPTPSPFSTSSNSTASYQKLKMRSKRPDTFEYLHDLILSTPEGSGLDSTVTVACCGPKSLVDSSRLAAKRCTRPLEVMRGNRRWDVRFEADVFGW